MYWYKNIGRHLKVCLYLVLLLTAVSCNKPNVKEAKSTYKYFDLKGFMRSDSLKLALANPSIIKTVNHNGETETKTLKIANWGNELSLFTASDINKPSWRDSYTETTEDNVLNYTAKTTDLKTQRLTITRMGNRIKAIHIFNHTKNMLYETSEELSYFPDSVYIIHKKQHVVLLGSNTYLITGKFIK